MKKILIIILSIFLLVGCNSVNKQDVSYYNFETDGRFVPEKVDNGLYKIYHRRVLENRLEDQYFNFGTCEFFDSDYIYNWSNHTFIRYNFDYHYGYPIDKELDEINYFLESETPFYCQYDQIQKDIICESYVEGENSDNFHMEYQTYLGALIYYFLPEEKYNETKAWSKDIPELIEILDEITSTFLIIDEPVSSVPYLKIQKRQ